MKNGQAPMVVTGFDQKGIRGLIEDVVASEVKKRIVNKTDVMVVDAEKNAILIEQIRKLVRGLTLTPIRSRRLAIVHDAHKLTLPAANALLKSLEEPPEYVRYILTTSWASRLPTTILSRCVRVRVNSSALGGGDPESSGAEIAYLKQSLKNKELKHEDVEIIGKAISSALRMTGPSKELILAAMRLVDYYRVKGSGGNDKLAREVLLMYLPNN